MTPDSTQDASGPRNSALIPGDLISVIVPHFNDLENLAGCLASVQAQTLPPSQFEVIVADNNSDCGLSAVQNVAGGRASVIPAPFQGAGPARNAGVAAARGNILAFIDSDCFADPDWLAEGLKGLSSFDYVGGRVDTSIRDPHNPSVTEAYEAVFAFNFKRYIEQEKFSGTGNLFVPRAVFNRVGAFRDGVSEDIEWCHRANAIGYRLGYAPEAIVTHPARETWQDLTKKTDRIVREQYLLACEKPAGKFRWVVHAALVAVSPFFHFIRVLTSDRLTSAVAKGRGLRGLFCLRFFRFGRMIGIMFE